jgi:uncharacterized Zn-finger protein
MFFSPLDIRTPLALSHRHHDWLALSLSAEQQPSSSSSNNVYNLWQNASSDLSSYALHHLASSTTPSRSFPNFTYQDDRSSNSRLVPMLPYSPTSTNTNDTFTRRSTFPLSPSPQHIPTSPNSLDEDRSSRSLIFDPIYPSPSYTLSAAISSAPGSSSIGSPPSAPLPPLLSPPPPPSSCSPHTSPCSSPPSSPDCHPLPPPSLPSVHAFRLDTLQSVDPSDDPCPLSLHDLMIPSEEQEYQGHSYHFSLQSVSPSHATPQSFSDEKPHHEESALPKRKGKSKMHTCALCQKSFPRPSGLRTHMNSHSGDKRASRCVAYPKSADLAHFVISLQVPCYVLCQVIHCPFKRKASHSNARRPSGSSSRGSLAFRI